jgi:hypothetical protein
MSLAEEPKGRIHRTLPPPEFLTRRAQVATEYASTAGGVLYELTQGMGDRGADLGWLSQYPHERERCFPPLTGLEVVQ